MDQLFAWCARAFMLWKENSGAFFMRKEKLAQHPVSVTCRQGSKHEGRSF